MNRQFLAFRGIAILIVLVNHSITIGLMMAGKLGYPQPPLVQQVIFTTLVEFGLFAVPIFLFLSGAFFVYSSQAGSFKQSYKTVWVNLVRVAWPYIIWSLVFYLMVYLLFEERYSVTQYLKDLVVGYPYNFVPILMVFYLLAPILVWAAKKFPVLLILFFGVLQLLEANLTHPGLLQFVMPAWTHALEIPVLRNPLADWGIYFPLGVVVAVYRKSMAPWLDRLKLAILVGTIVLFITALLSDLGILKFPLADTLCPMVGMLLIPLVRRESIPFVQHLEFLGKRAYGLYLTNLVILNVLIFVLQNSFQQMLGIYPLVVPFLFAATLALQLVIMQQVERFPKANVYRYVFG